MSVQMAPRPVPYEEELTREAVWNKSPKPAPRQSQRLSERHPDSPLLATQLLPPPTSSGLKVSMLQASAPGGVAGAGMDAHLRARTFEQVSFPVRCATLDVCAREWKLGLSG